MAIIFDAPVTPDALSTFVREVPMPANLLLSAAFPERAIQDNRVDLAEIVHTNRTATFRPFDGAIGTMPRDTGSVSEVHLLPLSNSLNMGEYERLQLQFIRTAGTAVEALAHAIYNDAQHLVASVRNRIEVAWGDVLTDGKLTINENGYQGEADFGVPASQLVTAGTVWTTLTANALTDLAAWVDTYVANNGFRPGSFSTSLRVQRLLQRNTEVINAVYGATAGRTRVSTAELNTLLESEGLPTLRTTYDTQVDVDGVSTRVIADDKIVFLPPNVADLGYLAMGVSATALELVNSNASDLSFENAAGIVGVVDKSGPPYRQQTLVDATGMPILANAKLLMVADVA